MDDFCLQVLGSGSAMPSKLSNQSAQMLTMRNKAFLIDCGEGTQIQIMRNHISTARLSHIFISHLHGDHCFGLLGLISTLGMKQHKGTLYIHAHPMLESFVRPALEYFCRDLSFNVVFEPYDAGKSSVIYEDRSVQVSTIPLKHTLPTCGFLFKETPRERHIIREKIDFYKIPVRQIPMIKNGADFITADGDRIRNQELTTAPSPSKSYAYCSDTMFRESIIEQIRNVDLLFHEATFLHEHLSKAKKTMHSTALQAATIAKNANVKKLVIGHFSARYSDLTPLVTEARTIFPNTDLAIDLKKFFF